MEEFFSNMIVGFLVILGITLVTFLIILIDIYAEWASWFGAVLLYPMAYFLGKRLRGK